MSKFTPGPWEAFVSADVASVVKNKQGLGIARVVDDYDAYLIAAAPAMYESLSEVVAMFIDSQRYANPEAVVASELRILLPKMQAALRVADGGE